MSDLTPGISEMLDAIRHPDNWDNTLMLQDMYRSAFVAHIERQEALVRGREHLRLESPKSGTKFSSLCKLAVRGKTDPWVPMVFTTPGLTRRAQLVINMLMLENNLQLAKMIPGLYDMCLEIMHTNLKALMDTGEVSGMKYLKPKVPRYSDKVEAHAKDTFKELISMSLNDPANYIFYAVYYSFPVLGQADRCCYSVSTGISVARGFFATDGGKGAKYLNHKRDADRENINLFAGARS